jgi:hypothetical protein
MRAVFLFLFLFAHFCIPVAQRACGTSIALSMAFARRVIRRGRMSTNGSFPRSAIMNSTVKAVTLTLAMVVSGAAFAAGGSAGSGGSMGGSNGVGAGGGNTQGAAGVVPDSNRNSKNTNSGYGNSGYGSPGTTGVGGGQGAGTGATPNRAPSTMPGSQQSTPNSSQ